MSEPAAPSRRLLGTAYALADRARVYWTDEALEVDRIDNYEIRRRRVFFDEVLLVTLHSRRGGMAAAVPVLMAVLFGLLTLVSNTEPTSRRVFLAATALFAAWAAAAFFIPVWVVTVFGKRTRARMNFRMKQARAREVYAEICRATSDAQRARVAAEPPPIELEERT
jgi:hypothetical protein